MRGSCCLTFVRVFFNYFRVQMRILCSSFLLIAIVGLAAPRANAVGAIPATALATIRQMEDSMMITADSMYGAFLPDMRLGYSERFARQLVRALRIENSWAYPFPKIGTRINIISPDDKSFRIFNWDIAPTEDTRRYYGAIQLAGDKLKLYGLVDISATLPVRGAEDSLFAHGKWMGALYYRIIPHEVGGRMVYSLLGLNAASRNSNKKILEPLTIEDDGPHFGAPIVNVGSELHPGTRVNRFILEYKKDVQVKLNWSDEYGCIIFDDLVSQTNDPARKYTYVPSGQMNGLKWNGTGWDYVQNLVPVVPRKDGEAPINEPR